MLNTDEKISLQQFISFFGTEYLKYNYVKNVYVYSQFNFIFYNRIDNFIPCFEKNDKSVTLSCSTQRSPVWPHFFSVISSSYPKISTILCFIS